MATLNISFPWVLTKRALANVFNFAVPCLGWNAAANTLIPLAVDASGNLSKPVATRVNSAAYEASHILKASAGTLIQVQGYNSGGAQFIQLHDSATLPADTAAPALVIAVGATSNFSITVPVTGEAYANGIVVCNSSTGPTKTIGSANCYFTADVI